MIRCRWILIFLSTPSPKRQRKLRSNLGETFLNLKSNLTGNMYIIKQVTFSTYEVSSTVGQTNTWVAHKLTK